MITSIKYRATIVKVLALGFLLATLAAMLVSTTPPAGAVVPSEKAFAWGENYDGQLGNDTSGTDTGTNIPAAVKNLSGVKSVKAGCHHSLALKKDGTVWAWGRNVYGQLGNGTNDSSDVPVKVNTSNVKAISAGCNHSLALKENGTVWAWGSNYFGQLGNGNSGTDSNVPVKVINLGIGAKGIAGGGLFSLALMKDGTVRSWGYNYYGQLGNGSSLPGTDRAKPVRVVNLSNVKAIATDSAAQHVLALLNNGTVRAWGYNYSGELGNGSSLPGTDRSKPVRVIDLTGVEAIATGGNHSLALLASGKVKSWGGNYVGQLGNDTSGASTNRSIPGNVKGLENVMSISGGAAHSLAILENGRVRSWGYNSHGQLGNGTDGPGTNSDVPAAVKDLTGVRSIDGGYEFTLAATQ